MDYARNEENAVFGNLEQASESLRDGKRKIIGGRSTKSQAVAMLCHGLARMWNVQPTAQIVLSFSSRPGGGLFGRPVTPTSPGRFYFCVLSGTTSSPQKSVPCGCGCLFGQADCGLAANPSRSLQVFEFENERDGHFVAFFRNQHSRAAPDIVGK